MFSGEDNSKMPGLPDINVRQADKLTISLRSLDFMLGKYGVRSTITSSQYCFQTEHFAVHITVG